MTNDDIFIATTTWQAVQLGGSDIAGGTFTLFNIDKKRIDFRKSDTQPLQSVIGTSLVDGGKESIKITLTGADRMFCKAGVGTAKIGVIPA